LTDEVRTKPLLKPKPDPRKSTRFLNPPKLEEEQPKEPEPKPAPKPEPVKVEPVKAEPESKSLSISAKWKVNYDELEFSDLVSSGSAGEVYLGYFFGTPVAIKSKSKHCGS
jgi:hypothetical protein